MPAKLDNVALFNALPERDLAALADHAVIKAFPKNTVMVNEGDETDSLYVILSGRVKIFLADENGREFILGGAGPGEYFGEVALDGGPRSASVMTLEPCRFAVIARAEMKVFIGAHPGIALSIMINLSRRVRTLTENVKSLALMDVYGRVARLLLDLARKEKGTMVVGEALTQQAIADRVGASRVMISRILKDLTTGGYISMQDRKIVIHRKPPAAW